MSGHFSFSLSLCLNTHQETSKQFEVFMHLDIHLSLDKGSWIPEVDLTFSVFGMFLGDISRVCQPLWDQPQTKIMESNMPKHDETYWIGRKYINEYLPRTYVENMDLASTNKKSQRPWWLPLKLPCTIFSRKTDFNLLFSSNVDL